MTSGVCPQAPHPSQSPRGLLPRAQSRTGNRPQRISNLVLGLGNQGDNTHDLLEGHWFSKFAFSPQPVVSRIAAQEVVGHAQEEMQTELSREGPRLPNLDHSKLAVRNRLTSPASRRVCQYGIDQFIAWYCSESLAFNRIVFLRCPMHLESSGLAANTINRPLAAVRRLVNDRRQRAEGEDVGRAEARVADGGQGSPE